MSLIYRRPWTRQPQVSVGIDWGNPITKGLIFAANPRDGAQATIRNVTGLTTGAVSALAYGEKSKADAHNGQPAIGVGFDAISSSDSAWMLPQAALNTLIATTGQASAFAVLKASEADSIGNRNVFRLRNTGGNNEHYPFTDGNIYIQPFSNSRWVSGVAPPTSIYVPHTYCATHKSGAQEFYFNNRLLATGSVAETPAMGVGTTEAVGCFGASGYAYCIFLWNRILTASERASLNANPWQLFAPLPRRIWAPAAGGGTTFTITPSGGVTLSGAAALLRTRVQAVSGGITFSGTAPQIRERAQVPTGGVVLSGTAPVTFVPFSGTTYTITPSGGVTFSGAAAQLRTRVQVPAGGIVLSGAVSMLRTRAIVPAGGIVFSGEAPQIRDRVSIPIGGVTFSGTAGIIFIPAGGLPSVAENRISIGVSRAIRLS